MQIQLEKRTGERRLYDLTFKKQPEFDDDAEAIISTDVAYSLPVGLVVENHAFAGATAQFWISGGENGKTYTVIAPVNTTNGSKLIGSFDLLVRDPWQS